MCEAPGSTPSTEEQICSMNLKYIFIMFLLLEVSSVCGDESKEESMAATPAAGKAARTQQLQAQNAVFASSEHSGSVVAGSSDSVRREIY